MLRCSTVTASVLLLLAEFASADDSNRTKRPPNFVLFFCDNLGYGDIACLGSTKHRTPHVDRLAALGMTFTACYSASGVCTPSRAAVMTGCYPRRVNMEISDLGGAVLQPVSPKGLHPDEITLAEVLKPAGYATTCIGKWHLGDQLELLPTRQGFDEYFGIPYSDDMTPREGKPWPPLPLMKQETVIEAPVDRDELTRRYTEASIDFIHRNKDQPFFLYLPQAMPGSTQHPYASAAFRGKSANGPWGDSVEELDWSLGEIVRTIDDLQLSDDTLIIFTSDNGAPRRSPPQGSNLPWNGWGYSTEEGAMRMPFIVCWTGHAPAGRECGELATLMDLYPTFAKLAGVEIPKDRIIDGRDITALITGTPDAQSPHEAFYYYQGRQLQAVRDRRWKLYLPLEKKLGLGRAGQSFEGALYDLLADPGEFKNRYRNEPDVVQRLMSSAEIARRDLGDLDQPGKAVRPAGLFAPATPRLLP